MTVMCAIPSVDLVSGVCQARPGNKVKTYFIESARKIVQPSKKLLRKRLQDRLSMTPAARQERARAYQRQYYRDRFGGIQPHQSRRPATQERLCLCCRKTFNSAGIHNRLCSPCKSGGSEPDYMVIA